MSSPPYNVLVYESLPPAEAYYQLVHIHESRVKDLVVSHFVCLSIAVVAIALRFVSRRMSKTPLKGDDWMIVVALTFELGYIIAVLLCVLRYGGGRHAILLTNPIKFAQSVLAAEILYPPAIASVKISTLLLYARLFPDRRFRIMLYTVGTFVATYSGIQVLTALFQCRPIRAAWDTTVPAVCIRINLCWMIMAGLNVLTDLIVLGAPLPTLWRLQMPNQTKLQLMGIFCIGGFVCIVSIYRIPKLHDLSLVDASWCNADPTIWSLVEVCVGIACACAIVCRPLVNWAFGIRAGDSKAAGNSDASSGDRSKSRSRSRPKIVEFGSSGSGKRWGGPLLVMDKVKSFGGGKVTSKPVLLGSQERGGFQQF